MTDEKTLSWYAAFVRYQREQAISTLLQAKGVDTYVPTYRDKRQWSDRTKELDRALFPGYVFFRLGPGDWFKVQSTAGVVRVIGVGKQPIAVDPAEMEAVRKLVAAGVGRKPIPFLGVGDLVEVQGGPIDGFTGILREIRNERTLIISIGLLKRSVAIHLEDGWVTVAKMPQAVRPNPVASLENLDSVRGRRSA